MGFHWQGMEDHDKRALPNSTSHMNEVLSAKYSGSQKAFRSCTIFLTISNVDNSTEKVSDEIIPSSTF